MSYVTKEMVLDLHLKKGWGISRISDHVQIGYKKIKKLLGEDKLPKPERRKREKQYLRQHAREIMDEEKFKRRVRQDIQDAGGSEKEEVEKVDKKERAAKIKWMLRHTDWSYKDISMKFDISSSMVSKIASGNHWTDAKPIKPNNKQL